MRTLGSCSCAGAGAAVPSQCKRRAVEGGNGNRVRQRHSTNFVPRRLSSHTAPPIHTSPPFPAPTLSTVGPSHCHLHLNHHHLNHLHLNHQPQSPIINTWPHCRAATHTSSGPRGPALAVVLHGACALYVISLAGGSYILSRRLAGSRYGLLVVWAYACGTLLLARLTEGLAFAQISPSLASLDRHRGLLRWHIHYNLVVLRLISFAADMHWARRGGGKRLRPAAGTAEGRGGGGDGGSGSGGGGGAGGAAAGGYGGGSGGGPNLSGLEAELRALTESPLPLPYYGLLPFLEYVFYPPLYIAGPIITFNSFAAQRMMVKRRQPLLGLRQVLLYAARAALAWFCLEGLTHALPYNSIAKHRVLDWLAASAANTTSTADQMAGWPTPRPLHYAITGYWVLVFMWLKFLVMWRFFRLVSLADSVVPPENMTRCVCNNYDIEGFWRSWHASYNRWLVRYMYVPLGGSHWRAVNVWLIFTFVALWHDLEWRLLGWAWLMAAAIAPEMLVKALGRSSWLRRWRGSAALRHAAALAAAANILMLMSANLVGFVVGVDGIRPLLAQILGQPRFLGVVLVALFSAVQLMFWKRECEARAAAAAAAAQETTATATTPRPGAAAPTKESEL
ncbi:hypothetical protein PLESTB_000829800 [Pleodorina starrii]|uniref:Uncharacterized protein n=1 Tax=Pleodorina starrii TaxID=330485 RepID=A0A9W6BMN8_9CHLO|nr:hypothetical protein PLESTB_000829800 [Pleodorina starrii]